MESIANSRLTKYSPGAMGGTPMGGFKPTGRPGSGGGPGGETFFRKPANQSAGKGSTDIWRFPLAVDEASDQGHYMIFEVMQTTPAQLLANKVKSAASLSLAILNEQGTDEDGIAMTSTPLLETLVNAYKANQGAKQSGPNSLQVKTPATADVVATAALYMPPSVQVTYGANYGETDMGVTAESVAGGFKKFQEMGGIENMEHALAGGLGTAAGGIASGILNKGKEKLPAGAEAMFAINAGSIITPRMELMFEGIMRRIFSFEFTFIPKSIEEAAQSNGIVKMFTKHMSSDYGGIGVGGVDGVREMKIPNFFNIRYMYRGDNNNYINKIKQCVLTKADVIYGADQYKAFETGQPQTTKLTLNFTELELITKKYVDEGY